MNALKSALISCLVILIGQGCATCRQTQAEPTEKAAWWEKELQTVDREGR